jgi:hypothetical protein
MDAGGINQNTVGNAVWTTSPRALTTTGGPGAGQTLQALSQTTGISLTAVATTNIVNFSGAAGTLYVIGSTTTTAFGAGNITAFIDIITDLHTMSIPLYASNVGWDKSGQSLASNLAFTTLVSAGSGLNDTINFSVCIGFTNSLTVAIRITATTLASGACSMQVIWAHA